MAGRQTAGQAKETGYSISTSGFLARHSHRRSSGLFPASGKEKSEYFANLDFVPCEQGPSRESR